MPNDDISDCIKINPPEAIKPLSKAFGSMRIFCAIMFSKTCQWWVERFSKQEEYPPGFDADKPFDYMSREDALQVYTDASTELCRQWLPRCKSCALVPYSGDFSIHYLRRHHRGRYAKTVCARQRLSPSVKINQLRT